MDAFAVAIACSVSLRRVSHRHVFRLAFHFGLFQALMPLLGWSVGKLASGFIRDWDHWIAFALLVTVGSKAVYEALHGGEDPGDADANDPTTGLSLVVLSIATSIDALAVGVSLAMIGVQILEPAAIIGVITAAVTAVGMLIGARLGERFGSRMEIVGGIVLILIGFEILLSHVR